MDRPNVITTRKLLPFGELEPLEFERLCLWLVEREGYLRPQHLGEAGSEQGRDIVAFRSAGAGEEMWYFQCKRYRSIGAATLKKEVEKYNALTRADPAKRPAGIVFITNAAVSARTRESVGECCQRYGYGYDFWARTELDMRVKKHPEIVEEFFFASPVPMPLAPHQLPPPPRDFTGRQDELDELMPALEQGGVTISSLQGLGGVGKTTLALKVAHQLARRYPDAQIYLDLKGTEERALSSTHAMSHVIRSYRPTVKLPESEAELSALYRSVLHRQRALLLMDNAASREQVEPLIPPESCMMLVTSRRYFTLPGLLSKRLGALSAVDARDLLLRIAPRIGDAADAIAQLTSCLPLALRLVASTLAERIDLDIADYARRLADTQQRLKALNEVEASLSLSYGMLGPQMQKLWRAVAVFPDTFEVAAAAALWELDRDAAQDALGELLNLSLVEWLGARYRLHDLVRLFAHARLSESERMTAERRHAAHYLKVLQEANRLYREGSETLKRGLELFDSEWTNIRRGQGWAAQHSGQDADAAGLLQAYPGAGATLLNLRLHPRERIAWLQGALSVDSPLKDRAVEVRYLNDLGDAYKDVGETNRAMAYYQQALSRARSIGDRPGEGDALEGLGWACYLLSETDRAIEHYREALTIAREARNRRGEARVLSNLGLALVRLNDPDAALACYVDQLAITREIGDRAGEGNALGNFGDAYLKMRQPEMAVGFLEERLSIAREIGDRRHEGIAQANLGRCYLALGKTGRSLEYHREALAIAREMGNRRGEAQALGSLGSIYQGATDYETAIDFYLQSLAIHRETGNRLAQGVVLFNIGKMREKLGDYPAAVVHAAAALEIFEDIRAPDAEMVRKRLARWREQE